MLHLSLCMVSEWTITSVRGRDVYGITALIRDWPTTVDHSSTLVATIRQFKNVSLVSLGFERSSFSEILASIQSSWVALYKACQSSSRDRDTYFLISLFSTLAFGRKINQSILRQLLQIAFSKKCQNVAVPRDDICNFFRRPYSEDLSQHAGPMNALTLTYHHHRLFGELEIYFERTGTLAHDTSIELTQHNTFLSYVIPCFPSHDRLP